MSITAEEIIKKLGLEPHPREGGFFCETYRSSEQIAKGVLHQRYETGRSLGTCIYYLLTPGTFSAMHRLQSDEIFHFYLGDPVEMLLLNPDGGGQVVVLGPDISAGMSPQIVIKRGIWQGARLIEGGSFALMGTTVFPGFEYADFELGERNWLLKAYPEFAKEIEERTHS